MSNKHFSDADAWRAASFAEVIESNLQTFTAQCWDWEKTAAFGSLVFVQQPDVQLIGCVVQLTTGSLEQNTYPFPYRMTESELRIQQPQIFEFLRTTFQVQLLAYRTTPAQRLTYLVPPVPARIHAFVQQADQELYEQFFAQSYFVHPLFSGTSQTGMVDELLLAMVRQARQRNVLDEPGIEQLSETFSLLTGNDYRRLKLFLGRLQALL